MRRTIKCILYILFQIALVVSLLTMNPIFKGVTMIIFFPFMLLSSMHTVSNGSAYNEELVITYDTIALTIEALFWDMAMKNGGIWIALFSVSVVLILYWLLFNLRRPS